MKKRVAAIGAAVAAILFSSVWPAAAHRLDEYLQAARFSVQRDRVDVEIDLTPGISVAPAVFALIDTNRDGQVTKAESHEYGAQVLRSIELYVDKDPVPLTLTSASLPDFSAMEAGTEIIRVRGTGKHVPLTVGRHELFYRNLHQPKISVYLANALVPQDKEIEINGQFRDTAQHELTIEYRVLPQSQWSSQPWFRAALALAGLGLPLGLILRFCRRGL